MAGEGVAMATRALPLVPLDYRMGVPVNPEAQKLANEYMERSLAEEKEIRELGWKLNQEGTLDMDHFLVTGEIRRREVVDKKPEVKKPETDEESNPVRIKDKEFYPEHPFMPGRTVKDPLPPLTKEERRYVTSSRKNRPSLPPIPRRQWSPLPEIAIPSANQTLEDAMEELRLRKERREADLQAEQEAVDAAVDAKKKELLDCRNAWKEMEKTNWGWPTWEPPAPLRRTQIYLRSYVRPGARKLFRKERKAKYQGLEKLAIVRVRHFWGDSETEEEDKVPIPRHPPANRRRLKAPEWWATSFAYDEATGLSFN